MATRTIVIVLSLVASSMMGCAKTVGNDDEASETRTVSSFTRVDAMNGVDVDLSIDPARIGDVELEVTAESNLLDLIDTDVSGSTLSVHVRGVIEAHLPMEVVGIVADIEDIQAANGSVVSVTRISQSALMMEARDGGRISVSGTAGQLRITTTDGGVVSAGDLTAGTADVDLDEGGDTTICVTGEVTGTVDNGATLTVECGGDTSGVSTTNGGSVQ